MIRTHRGAGSNTPASAVSMDATGSRRFSKHEPFSSSRSVSQGQQTRRIPVSEHSAISRAEAADRLAIRELVEAYAHCADRRDANGQMLLFTEGTHFVVYMNAKDPAPSMDLHSREALAPVFADLNKYDATTHFVGQSTIFTLTGDRATGELSNASISPRASL